MSEIFIGVDIGTSSTKAVAYDRAGRELAEGKQEYELLTSGASPDRAEQDVEQVLRAVRGSIREVTSALGAVRAKRKRERTIRAVGFCGAMHSILGVDRAGRPVTAALTFADTRAHEQARRLAARSDAADLLSRTGTPTHAMSPLSKLIWFREEEPKAFARAARWLAIKDYVLLRLTGTAVVDDSIASASGLFDVAGLDWDDASLQLAGVDRDQLPGVVRPTETLTLRPEAARQLGLARDVPLVVGAADGPAASLGAGAIGPGAGACTLGTSGALRLVLADPPIDRSGRTFRYAFVDGLMTVGGAVSNGGSVLDWLATELFPGTGAEEEGGSDEVKDRLVALAGEVSPGADGLLALPMLVGERAPGWDPRSRAALVGLRRDHGQGHVVRALLEAVAYQLRSVSDDLTAAGLEPAEWRLTGGRARTPAWLGILADVLGLPMVIPSVSEPGAWGAAILAMRAVDARLDIREVAAQTRLSGRTEPDPANETLYRERYEAFLALRDRLVPAG